MEIANIHQAKAQLSRLIELALAGEEVQIARSGEPLVRLVPIQMDSQPRQGNQLKGQIWISEDFDAPDHETIKLFEGDEQP
ncbi:type II toxin-antitoxin system Phd/YefM family antitoxin [Singulisphaera rosea]